MRTVLLALTLIISSIYCVGDAYHAPTLMA